MLVCTTNHMKIKKYFSQFIFLYLVCDNVHRTLSRYLHIQKHAVQKLPELGDTLAEFNDNLRLVAKDFSNFLEDVKHSEGFGSMDGTIDYSYFIILIYIQTTFFRFS